MYLNVFIMYLNKFECIKKVLECIHSVVEPKYFYKPLLLIYQSFLPRLRGSSIYIYMRFWVTLGSPVSTPPHQQVVSLISLNTLGLQPLITSQHSLPLPIHYNNGGHGHRSIWRGPPTARRSGLRIL
jgi:hypothetical protein